MWIYLDVDTTKRLCQSAGLNFTFFGNGDLLFAPGEKAETAFCRSWVPNLHAGSFNFGDRASHRDLCAESEWLSEAALWSWWQRVVTTVAVSEGKLLSLDAQSLFLPPSRRPH